MQLCGRRGQECKFGLEGGVASAEVRELQLGARLQLRVLLTRGAFEQRILGALGLELLLEYVGVLLQRGERRLRGGQVGVQRGDLLLE